MRVRPRGALKDLVGFPRRINAQIARCAPQTATGYKTLSAPSSTATPIRISICSKPLYGAQSRATQGISNDPYGSHGYLEKAYKYIHYTPNENPVCEETLKFDPNDVYQPEGGR